MRHPPLDYGAAALGLATVVAANCLYLAGLPGILDPMMSMEPYYIRVARGPLSAILAEDPGWGPLYAVWLKPFVAVLGDPVAVYSANLYALSFAVSLIIYLHLLLLSRRAAVAVGAALLFLISDFNVPLSNKVTGFALLVALSGLTVAELVPAGARRMSVAALAVLLAAYARPELYPASLCLFAVAVWQALGEARASDRAVFVWPAAGLACALIAAVAIGTPVFSPFHGEPRLLIAFREHFAWNWLRWNGGGGGRNFESIWAGEFGAAQTITQALLHNPFAVARHLGDNLVGTVRFMLNWAFDHYPVLVPATSPMLVRAESLCVSVAVWGILILVAVRREWRRKMVEGYGYALLAYASMIACGLSSGVTIYPLSHYLAIPSVLVLLAGGLAATVILPAPVRAPWPRRIVAALVCLAAVPKPFVLPSAYEVPGSPFKGRVVVSRVITDTIEFIHSLNLAPTVQVLAIPDGVGEILGRGFREIKIWQKGSQPLEAYMRDNDIGLIINLEGGEQSFMVDDPYWKEIHNRPSQNGFTRLTVPNHDIVRVYVRTDLMPKAGARAR